MSWELGRVGDEMHVVDIILSEDCQTLMGSCINRYCSESPVPYLASRSSTLNNLSRHINIVLLGTAGQEFLRVESND